MKATQAWAARSVLALALLALCRPGPVGADDASVRRTAQEVVAAFGARDTPRLAALVAAARQETWFVAEELVAVGPAGAAEAFAAATLGPEHTALPAYVTRRRSEPAAVEHADLRRIVEASGAQRHAEVLELAGAWKHASDSVTGIVVERLRAQALAATKRDEAPARVAAGEIADRIGWWQMSASCWWAAATIAVGRNEDENALARFGRALAAQEHREAVGNVAATRLAIAQVLLRTTRLREARAALEQALPVLEHMPDRWNYVEARAALATVDEQEENARASAAGYEVVVRYHEEAGNTAEAARERIKLASACFRLGDFPRALALYHTSLTYYETKGDARSMAIAWQGIGVTQSVRGALAEALAAYEQALALLETSPDRAVEADTRMSLARAYCVLGNHAAARSLLGQARALFEALGRPRGVLAVDRELALLLSTEGRVDEARQMLLRLLDVAKTTADARRESSTSLDLSDLFLRGGDASAALPHARRAVELERGLGSTYRLGTTLLGLAQVQLALHDVPAAGEAQAEAATLAQTTASRDLLGEVETARSMVLLARGDARGALAAAEVAIATYDDALRGLSDDQRMGVRARGAYSFWAGLRAASAVGDADGVFRVLEAGRAGSLLEMLSQREALREAAVPAPLRAAELEARGEEDAAVAALRRAFDGAEPGLVTPARARLAAARDAVTLAVSRIRREAARAAAVLYPSALPAAEVAAGLAPEEALVLYAWTPDEVLAVVLGRDARRLVRLGPGRELGATVEAAVLTASTLGTDPAAALESARQAFALPLALPATCRRVFVSSDGPLHRLPPALLGFDRETVVVPSGAILAILAGEARLRGEGVLALGDPDYSVASSGALPDDRAERAGFRRLPATRAEAQAVGDRVLLGREATEAGLRQALAARPRWRSVHLACHGLIDDERPMSSALALADGPGSDGLLTASEVFGMRIPADLVVLSACESGRGKLVATEGAVGLARAFLFAGTPRVLCSLWRVDDEATQALMTEFYRLWNPKAEAVSAGGLAAAEALRRAQEHVRAQERWKHPYYWAAWVLWGPGG